MPTIRLVVREEERLHPVETYVRRLREIREGGQGTPELSYRAALENLLSTIARDLDPQVYVTAELADTGAGHPDYGIFETGSNNLRIVVEVKSFEADTPNTADGSQVSRYWNHYGHVLVSNYRDFLLVVREGSSRPRVEGRYPLAPDADSFWTTHSKTLVDQHASGLTDFLIGAMTRSAPITRPKALADDLARHAREAKRRLTEHDMEALAPLRAAMEQALGIHISDEKGEAFFRSSLVQTLFYGLFSGWILWRQGEHEPGTFAWKDASDYLSLPLIGDLYEEIARPKRLADLNLREPLEWATSSINRVEEEAFFAAFDADHAITLFYEPFLQAFDPVLREELGIWYTPPEIVRYMVRRVDQLLRDELGIEDGLADDHVYVLDPAVGTGSYLIEVAKTINETLTEQGHGTLAATRVKNAIRTRLFGFELLPAPYVVAHLQLGVYLRLLGAPLSGKERAEVYLTNALTGWKPPTGPKTSWLFPELQKEAERAGKVKQSQPILVVLGNPPYYGYAGVAQEEEADLVQPYKDGLYERWGITKQLVDDLYVRFFRVADRQIGEVGGRGVVCYITNYSWLDGLSQPVMRERLFQQFDKIWIDNCNGDRFRTGKRTPDGKPDQSMFTVRGQAALGIQPGTAITSLVKRDPSESNEPDAEVRYRELWGLASYKREKLLETLETEDVDSLYDRVNPTESGRYAIYVGGELSSYPEWHSLPEILPHDMTGILTRRDEFVIDIDREVLIRRMRDYFNPRLTDAEIATRYPRAMEDGSGFAAHDARRKLLRLGFDESKIRRFYYRPFDLRWIYYEPGEGLVSRPSPQFNQSLDFMDTAIEMRQKIPNLTWDRGLVVTTLADSLGNGTAVYYPMRVKSPNTLRGERAEPNVEPGLLARICEAHDVDVFDAASDHYTEEALSLAEKVFYHVIAVLWSPEYRRENEAELRQNWPRLPVPADPDLLADSEQLGRSVANLLIPDRPVSGVTTGKIRPELRRVGIPSKVDGGTIDPGADLKVEVNWGFRGKNNAVMCGQGRTRASGDDPDALDVFINDRVYWSNVPADVWAMNMATYPVIKKWLSYREHKISGRDITMDDVMHVTQTIRRLKALLLLGGVLDANYRNLKTANV